jgi:hypothetical protein
VPHRCWALRLADVASLWDECPRCFYLAVVRGFPRPQSAAPSVLAQIDARLKACCDGRRTETLAPDMPPGVFELAERWLESRPLDVHLPDAVRQCVVRGRLDTLVRLDDGGWAVVEVGTAEQPTANLAHAARRLLGHAWALEHPAPGAFGLGPVARLGLLGFEPETFACEAGGLGALTGGVAWIEIPRDDAALFGFLAEALSVLDRPEPPGGAPLCEWCVYRDASRRTGL